MEVITGITTVNPGNGYKEGDVVGIVTSTVVGSKGRDARITISSITGVDTLYLENIQGDLLHPLQDLNLDIMTTQIH
jgi:hypothetical protein